MTVKKEDKMEVEEVSIFQKQSHNIIKSISEEEKINRSFFQIQQRKPNYQLQTYFDYYYNNNQKIVYKVLDTLSNRKLCILLDQYDPIHNSIYLKELIELYKGYQSLLRHDLLVQILDIWTYGEQVNFDCYIVIEMEDFDDIYPFIEGQLSQQNKLEAQIIMQQSIDYLNETMHIKNNQILTIDQTNFFIFLTDSNQIKVKLFILSDELFFYSKQIDEEEIHSITFNTPLELFLDQSVMCRQVEFLLKQKILFKEMYENIKVKIKQSEIENKQNEQEACQLKDEYEATFYEQDYERYLKLSFNINCKEQLEEIMSNNNIHKRSLINHIENNMKHLQDFHSIEIFKIIADHPKYKFFSFIEYGQDYFILKVSNGTEKLFVKCQKYKNMNEANKAYSLIEEYYSQDNPIFLPLKSKDIICCEDFAYIIVEENHSFSKEKRFENLKIKWGYYKLQQPILRYHEQLEILLILVQQIFIIFVDNQILENIKLSENEQKHCSFFNCHRISKCNREYENNQMCYLLLYMINKFISQSLKYPLNNIHQNLQQINNSISKIQKLWNSSKDCKENYLLRQELDRIANYLETIIQYQNLMDEIHEQQLSACILLDSQWKIVVTLEDYKLKETIEVLSKYEIEKINLNKNIQLQYIGILLLPTLNSVKTLTIEQQIQSYSAKCGLERFISLFPNVKELLMTISYNNYNQNYNSINFNILHKLIELESINLTIKNNDQFGDITGFQQILELFKTKITFKRMNLNLDFFDVHYLKKTQHLWDRPLFYTFNKQNNQVLQVKTSHQKRQISVQLSQQMKQIITFFGQENYDFQKMNSLLIYLIENYNVEFTVRPSSFEEALTLVFSCKQLNFEDLIIDIFIDKLNYPTSVKFIHMNKRCQECFSDNYTQFEFTMDTFEQWWIVEHYTQQIKKFIGNEFETSCYTNNKNQQQVIFYKNQTQLEYLYFKLYWCDQTTQQLKMNTNYFQFSNLVWLNELTFNIQDFEFYFINIINYLILHFKQIRNLSTLRIEFCNTTTDFNQQQTMSKSLLKLKKLVKLDLIRL